MQSRNGTLERIQRRTSAKPDGNLPKTASYNFAAQYCSQSDWEQAFSGEGASEREREREVMVVFGTDDIEKIKADLRDLKESGDEPPWDAEDAPPGLSWTCPKGETCKCNKGGPRRPGLLARALRPRPRATGVRARGTAAAVA
eukprot:COSAG06_NODE_27629_length_589_cov_1.642857_1_plen_142_part_10